MQIQKRTGWPAGLRAPVRWAVQVGLRARARWALPVGVRRRVRWARWGLPVGLAASAAAVVAVARSGAGPPGPVVPAALLLALLGLGAGAAARVLLGRLRRGAVVRPPWCEAAVAVVWALTGGLVGAGLVAAAWGPVLLGLGWLAVAAGAVDVLHRRLPDALTLPALPAALLLLAPLGSDALLRGLLGAAVAAAAHAAVRMLAPRALGGGDVKLAAPLGVVLAAASWAALALAAGLAALLTGAVAAAGLATRRLRRRSAIPHGLSMLVASWLVVAGAAVTAGGG